MYFQRALEVIQTDGKIALDKARERAREIGQQNDQMTNLAQEAREIADRLDESADEITDIAVQAKNVSTEALDLYKQASEQQNNIRYLLKYI